MMHPDRLRVYITIDTETSLGGAWQNPTLRPLPLETFVYGKLGDRFLGIPLVMDILEEHGFRGTFFTEVFCGYTLGFDGVAAALSDIQKRGHDAQLHLHPIYRFYHDRSLGRPSREVDFLFQLPISQQHDLVGEGVAIFRRLTGRTPRAFRAGCYAASQTTLSVLRAHGIAVDSSYNQAYMGPGRFDCEVLNAPTMIDGVLEAPVTSFRGHSRGGYKPLEISAVSVSEVLATLEALYTHGHRDAVLVLHSFSLLKQLSYRYERFKGDRIVIHRFRRLCKALSDRSGKFTVAVLGDTEPPPAGLHPQPDYVPLIGLWRPAARKLVQGANRLRWL